MPKLPTAEVLGERPVARPDSSVVSYRPVGDASAGEAMVQASRQMQAVGDEMFRAQKIEAERIDRALAMDALNQLSAVEQELQYGDKGFMNVKGGDAVKAPLVKDYFGRFTESANLIKQGLKTDRQKELFDSASKANFSRFRGSAYRHVEQQSDVFYKAVFADTKATALAEIGANWNNDLSVASAINKYNAAVDFEADRLGLPELKTREKAAFLDAAVKTRVDAQRMVDPVGALSTFQESAKLMSPAVRQSVGEAIFRDAAPVLAADILRGGKVFASDEQQAIAILKDAESAKLPLSVEVRPGERSVISQLPADQRIRLMQFAKTQGQQDAAQVREGLAFQVQDATEMYERGIVPPVVPSRDSLVAAFGEEKGNRVTQSLESARLFGENVARLSTMSMVEMGDLLTSSAPKAGPGFAVEQKRHDELRGAMARVLQDRQKDPAAAVLQTAPVVKSTYEAMVAAPSPQSAQAFAQATLAEQKRLGVSVPAVLPKPMADQIVRQFNDLSEGAQRPTQIIQAQAAQWGAFWPQVYQQIAKDISPTARVVANLRDTPAAALLSQSAQLKTEELKKAVLTEDAKVITDQVDSSLEPFRRSLIGWTSGGSGTYNDFEEAAKRLAYIYSGQGQKPADAAKRAARELVDEYYDFRGSVRIPRSVDASAVERGMSSVLKGSETLGVRVPESEAKLLGPEFVGQQLAKSVKSNGFFVTLGDDSGVALFLQGANGARAIEGADGRPITFTWRELQDAASEDQRQPGAVSYGETEGGAVTGRVVR